MYHLYRWIAQFLSRSAAGAAVVRHIARHWRLYETVERALLTVLLLVLLISFVVESCTVRSSSMADTLLEHDNIFTNRFLHRFALPRRGDIVVFTPPPAALEQEAKPLLYVKRVVGLPGDRLQLSAEGRLLVNGEPLRDPPVFDTIVYHRSGLFRRALSIEVPAGEIFVMGDNSASSQDSRIWGGVPLANLRGRAFFRFWPPSRIGLLAPEPRSRRLSSED